MKKGRGVYWGVALEHCGYIKLNIKPGGYKGEDLRGDNSYTKVSIIRNLILRILMI